LLTGSLATSGLTCMELSVYYTNDVFCSSKCGGEGRGDASLMMMMMIGTTREIATVIPSSTDDHEVKVKKKMMRVTYGQSA